MSVAVGRPGAKIFALILASALIAGPASAADRNYRLEPVGFADLQGFGSDRHDEALRVFQKSCLASPRQAAVLESLSESALKKACTEAARSGSKRNPRAFFENHFRPYRIVPSDAPDAFFTAYYQPEIPGSLIMSEAFSTPAYGLPSETILASHPDRGEIEDGALEGASGVKKLVYLRDRADLFLAQVQGSARVRLADGRVLHLAFAGRNGQPYTALARVLVQRGVATPAEMTMPHLLDWLRSNGLEKGQPGDDLLRQNRSFVFFSASFDKEPEQQPQGAGGAALTPMRSIAIDAHIWPYGLPFFIDADVPWRGAEPEPFRRLTIAQDTGSAIVGPGRADIYFGLGEAVGARAGQVRRHGQLYLLLPREREAPKE